MTLAVPQSTTRVQYCTVPKQQLKVRCFLSGLRLSRQEKKVFKSSTVNQTVLGKQSSFLHYQNRNKSLSIFCVIYSTNCSDWVKIRVIHDGRCFSLHQLKCNTLHFLASQAIAGEQQELGIGAHVNCTGYQLFHASK